MNALFSPAVPSRALLVHEAFELQRAQGPHSAAVRWQDKDLSYRDLGEAADLLADRLRSNGAAGRPIGIFLHRGIDLPVAVLAVLKAGGAYVPLDPAYPDSRITAMMRDSLMRTVLTERSLLDRLGSPDGVLPVVLDGAEAPAERGIGSADSRRAPVEITAADLAYVIYTSGSTGVPKGVAMPHGPLANLIAWQQTQSPSAVAARTLQFAALSFDVAFQEMFSTWAAGGTLIMIDEAARRDYHELLEVLDSQEVRRIFLPFVALQGLAQYTQTVERWPRTLREVITAGEQLYVTPAVRTLFRHLGDAVLVNQYGPSETQVVTSLTLSGDPAAWPDRPSIGRPISGARTYILDEKLRSVPPGVPGELCIGGPVLANGYLGMPEATSEKFRQDPFSADGDRLYRTGDLCRTLPDGSIEFLGRLDGQVKVRGHRVELGEVESGLRSLPGIADVAVVAVDSPMTGKKLVAHVIPAEDSGLQPRVLRAALSETLPDYMIPSKFVEVEGGFPLTPSGKVDRRALAERA